ncbi:MAG: ribosome maturation factor RimP [Candidatus Eisenbacteria bacterium]|nr:ribosome maturation factor RimP [Candidatus Eisenbacteria bacterium]
MTGRELERRVRPLVEELGFELVEATASRSRRRQAFRVFVDKEGGVAVKDCAFLSRRISQVLDQDPLLAGAYGIEVSSPGMSRPVRTPEQFRRFMGEKVHIRLRRPRNGRRKWTGRIAAVDEGRVTLAMEKGEKARFDLEEIEEARLELDPWKGRRS